MRARAALAVALIVLMVLGSVRFALDDGVGIEAVPEGAIPGLTTLGVPVTLPIKTPPDGGRRHPSARQRWVDAQLLVQVKPGVDEARLEQIAARFGAKVIERFPQTPNLFLLALPGNITVPGAAELLERQAEIARAAPNVLYYTSALPNDPQFGAQWGLHAVGSTDPADPDIDAAEYWDHFTGDDQAVIGVIDTGIDYRHTELYPNMWVNTRETAGNGIDDDGNGYVDDIHGIDAISLTGNPVDSHYHGTHVAGTIGAVGNNGLGVTGVAWTARIAACKFLDREGAGTDAGAVRCLDYFAALKARGGNQSSSILRDAIARHQARGIIFVAAAGNDATDNDREPQYPASFDLPNIVSVGAIDRAGNRAWFSNFGAGSVDLFAPGAEILSTFPGHGVAVLSGTSMAAPHVTGMIGLLAADDPAATSSQLIQHVLDSATRVQSLTGQSVTGATAHLKLQSTDRDADGMDDRWERRFGLNPASASDATQDADNDGLSNLREFQLGTLPTTTDTDADTLWDGREVNELGTNPLLADTDRDGLADAHELEAGTRPTIADTDGDGLTDGFETEGNLSDPLRTDTDGDGMNDGFEARHNLNPRDSGDAGQDSDGDGLDNRSEAGMGTNPRSLDSDADELSDIDELRRHGTNPIRNDTDGDGILDGWEIRYSLNPLLAADALLDADSDGATNLTEFRAGSDPRDAHSTPPNQPWSGLRGNPARSGHVPMPTSAPVKDQRWFKLRDQGGVESLPSLGAGHLFASRSYGAERSMVGLNLLDGTQDWEYRPPQSYSAVQPIIVNGNVITAFRNPLQSYTLVSLTPQGNIVYTERVNVLDGHYDNQHLMAAGNRVFLSAGNLIVAFDAVSGSELWRASVASTGRFSTRWVPAAGRSHVGVFVGETLYLLDQATGREARRIDFGSCGFAHDATVMFDATDNPYVFMNGCLARFDVSAGSVRWSRSDLSPFSRPTISGTRVFAVQPYGPVVALDTGSGNTVWSLAIDQSVSNDLASSSTHVFVPAHHETFGLNVADGSVAWRLPFTGEISLADDGVFALFTSTGIRVLNLDNDRDADGLPDWWERTYQLSVTRADDAGQDADGDGLTNLEEFRQRSHPRERDTDGDGLGDGDERTWGSNPRQRDTDADQLLDGQEVSEYRTNPTLRDSDQDAVDDAEEIQRWRTDPNSASSRPDLVYREHISFESEIPGAWRHPVPDTQTWIRSSSYATDGAWSIEARLPEGGHTAAIDWVANFARGELVFDFYAANPTSLTIKRNNGEYISTYSITSPGWQTYYVAIPEGTTLLQFEARGGFPQSVPVSLGFLDNVRFRKSAPLGSATNSLVLLSNQQLHEISIDGRSLRAPVSLRPERASYGTHIAATARHEIAIRDLNGWSFYEPMNDRLRDAPDGITGGNGPPVATPYSLLTTWGSGQIGRFDLEGRFLNVAGEPDTVAWLAYGKDGFVYSIDYSVGVRKYDAEHLQLISAVSLDSIESGPIAVDQNGRIYLINREGRFLFANDGTLIRQLETAEPNTINGALLDRVNRLVNKRTNGVLRVAHPELDDLRDVPLGNGLDQHFFGHLTSTQRDGPDTDLDGCPDWWEVTHGFLQFQPADGDADPDGDGLTNRLEFASGANPGIRDTDGDALNDLEESENGSDPTEPDSDLDGLTDQDERLNRTSSRRSDTDNDGVSDAVEVRATGTRPNDADSDDDGIPDGWELARSLNPLSASDASEDPDGDGLSNRNEFTQGTEIRNADSDTDGLGDSAEVRRGTRPTQRDTDDDLLDDGFEVVNGFNPLSAGEALADRDGDGFNNLVEARYGSDPRAAANRPVVPGWTGHRGGARHLGYSPVKIDTTRLARRWQVNLTRGDYPLNPLAVAHGRVLATIDSNAVPPAVISLDAQTGSILMRRELADGTQWISAPALAGNLVVTHAHTETGLELQVYDRSTGATRRRADLDSWFGGALPAPTVDGVQVIGQRGYSDGIVAMNLADGTTNWHRDFFNWHSYAPAVHQGRVIAFHSTGGNSTFRLSSFRAATGEKESTIVGPLGDIFAPHTVLAGFRDDACGLESIDLYCFDLKARKLRWRAVGSFGGYDPAMGNGEFYTNTYRSVIALDEQQGRRVWEWSGNENLTYPPVATASHVLVSSETTLYAIDIATRRATWNAPTPGYVSIGDNKMIYVAGRTGTITAYGWLSDSDLDGSPDEDDLDRDGDGMLNDWETRHGFNPQNAADGLQDTDNDGLTNFREHGQRTQPRSADTDGDGINDFQEVQRGYDPLDPTCRSQECVLIRNGLNLPILERAAKRR